MRVASVRALCLALAALVCASRPPALHAQATRPYFSLLTTRDGLSNAAVTAILQDDVGFLWVGTQDGLNRFDGHVFTAYRSEPWQPGTLSHGRITALLQDPDGTLWVGTQAGLNRFNRDRKQFSIVRLHDDPDGRSSLLAVNSLARDGQGRLWVATKRGLFYLDARTRTLVRIVPIPADPRSATVNAQALFTTPGGHVWASLGGGTPTRACRIDPVRLQCDPSTHLPGTIHALLRDEPRAPWLLLRAVDGTSELRRADGTERKPLPPIDIGQMTPGFNGVRVDRDRYWFGTSKGVLDIDARRGTIALIEPGLDPGSLTGTEFLSLYEDPHGTVWIGGKEGLHRWTPAARSFLLFRGSTGGSGGLSSNLINGLHEDRAGTLWAATNYGLNRLDAGAAQFQTYFYDAARSPNSNGFWSVFEDRNSVLWVGRKFHGLLRFDRARGRFEPEPEATRVLGHPSNVKARGILEDRRGRLWVSASTGLAVRDGATGRWRSYADADTARHGIANHDVNVAFEDRAGTVWVGADDGLYRYSEAADRFEHFAHDPADAASLSAPSIWTITERPSEPGVLWIGTIGGGLNRFDTRTRRFSHVTTTDGLPSNTVYGALPDARGRLWMSTNAGLVRYEPSTGAVTRFTVEDGLQGDAFDFMASGRGRGGVLYFGGPHGFNRFHPDSVRATGTAGPLVLTNVRVLGAPRVGRWSSGDTLRLRAEENAFAFEFAALDLVHARRHRYRYRLAGFDEAWRVADAGQRVAMYTNVPPGQYVFEVAASTHDGAFPNAALRLHVDVVPHFWQTRTFRWGGLGALGALALGLVYGTLRRRFRRLERHQGEEREVLRRLGESRDRERLRIARELHDGPMQQLYTLGHELDHLAGTLNGRGETVRGMRRTLDSVSDELRELLGALRPSLVQHLGVAAALEAHLRRLQRRLPTLDVVTDFETDGRDLPEPLQHALFRIGQEAIGNVGKHAHATRVEVGLAYTGGAIVLTVRDDGRGFALPDHLFDLARSERFGLIGALERAQVLGGTVTVETAQGRGTLVRAELPLAPATESANLFRARPAE